MASARHQMSAPDPVPDRAQHPATAPAGPSLGKFPGGRLEGCPTCGQVQIVPLLGPRQRARCARCDRRLAARASGRNAWAAATALSALIVFPVAVALPVLEISQFGASHATSVWHGSVALLTEGALLAGIAVFVCSILAPPLKLIGLLLLCRPPERLSAAARARLLRALEWAGRWGMLDVLLVAVLVAGLKLGDLVRVRPGPGAVAFTLVVVASLVAAALFDPRALFQRALRAEPKP